MNEIMQAISTVGFPIAMCVALLWYCRELIKEHKEETNLFTTALNNNTLALKELSSKLQKED